jgi:hypothetical protein
MEFTKHVRPLLLDEVRANINNHDMSYILDAGSKYETAIKEWLKPVVDLSNFFVYPINGITEGLNYWMHQETRSITKYKGDYEWVDLKEGKGNIHYMSVPSSIDGNFHDIPTDIPVALDLAYVGTTHIEEIPMTDNIEVVFYSLSKPFGLKNIRTGWMFTRKRDIKLHRLVMKANYYNYNSHYIAELIINKYHIDYIYNKLKKKQEDICATHNLTPSDCVWLATSADREYDAFKRFKTNRLCLSELFND